uniref:Tyrosyl-DNA phosphodiesterase n=1 Tax=Podoviridae sp. ctsNK10 TaxID=2826582 RepID=A0A8S5NMC0_9CAUD|nr:MAG TPA: tyrosyl-DNA phosphodiesterase [Podoviridae sp. ctsNK10]
MTIQGVRHCISTANLTANDCSKHLLFAEY